MTTGHLFYATSSIVHHFIAIGEFKIIVIVLKRPIRDKIANFLSRATLKSDRWLWTRQSEGFDSCDRPSNLIQIEFKSSIVWPIWPWNLLDDLKKQYGTSAMIHQALCIISKASVNSNWSYSPAMLNSNQSPWSFVMWLCDLEIRWMTLKNNRASFLCYFKLCESFHSHQWIQTGVTVQKRQIQVNISNFFCPVRPSNLMEPWKTIGHLFYATSKLCASFHNNQWIQTLDIVRKCPNWGNSFFYLCDLHLWPLILIFCMDITTLIGNHSWKCHDDMTTGTKWTRASSEEATYAQGQCISQPPARQIGG